MRWIAICLIVLSTSVLWRGCDMSLGPELIDDVGFDSPAAWDTSAGDWIVSGSIATATEIGGSIRKSIGITSGIVYQILIEITDMSWGGDLVVSLGGTPSSPQPSDIGSHVLTGTAGSSNTYLDISAAGVSGEDFVSIDNVSVREVIQDGSSFDFSSDPNDIWDF